MDPDLTPEQEQVRQMVRDFAESELRPIAREIDRTSEFPRASVRRMGELGLLGMTVPPEYGGAGTDTVCFALAAEELCRVSAAHSVIFGANNSLTCGPLLNFGTEEQKRKYLVPLAQGKHLGAYALTEPQAGSDAANQRTRAVREGDSWVLNGQKVFCSNGGVADTLLVFARTSEDRNKGVSCFVVPKATKGLEVGKPEKKLGIRASPTNALFFRDLAVPAGNLLGGEGMGLKIALSTLDGGRIMAAAGSTGIAQAAFEDSLAYAKERRQFGAPIGANQAIQWKLADMAVNIETARLLYRRAAWLKDQRRPFTKEASMAKLFASEMAMRATIEAIQVHGGNGYTAEYNVERYFRDIKIFEIFEGTSEIQRIVIARSVLGQ